MPHKISYLLLVRCFPHPLKMVKAASVLLLPLVAGHVSAVSMEHEHTAQRLHHHSSRLGSEICLT